MGTMRRLLMTMGLGAGLMYLFDPELGNRRRSQLQDQVTGMQNDLQSFVGKGTRDLNNRAEGIASEAKGMVGGSGDSMRAGDTMSNLSDMLDKSWPPSIQLIGTISGALMIISGMIRGGLMGTIRSMMGVGILARSVSNKPVRKIFGVTKSGESGAIDMARSVNLDAPVEEVFDMWHNYSNLPKFMSYLKEVRDLGDGRSHWVAQGPAGITVEWDAKETQIVPNKLIAWQSEPGSMIQNAGAVRFNRVGENSTRVDVRLSYTPPGGVLGEALVSLLGANPEQKLAEELNRFKSLVEQGKTTAKGQEVTREEVTHGQNPGQQSGQGTYNR